MKKRINRKFIIIFLAILQLIFVSESLCADIPSNQRGIGIQAKDMETGIVHDMTLYRKMHAVIIGIDNYPALSQDKQLKYAVNDAKGVEKVLREKYRFDNVYTLYNERATKSEILKILEGELSRIDEEDAVFIFFAGHGTTLEVGKNEKRNLDYIIPYDGTFKQDEMYRNISLSALKNDVGDVIPAKHLFYVLDSCYSGALLANTRSGGINPESEYAYFKESTSKPIRQAFTAGADGQTVLDNGPNGHSVFTGQFIKRLEEAKNYITAKTLGRDVTGAVILAANERSHKQTPRMGKFSGDDGGDFVFVPKNIYKDMVDVKPGGTLLPEGDFTTEETSVLAIAADPMGKIIAVGGIHGIELFDAVTRRRLRSFENGTTVSLQFSPDGKKLATGGYKKINIWDISTGRHDNLPTQHMDYIVSLTFSPDGSVLASGSKGSDRTIEIIDLKDNKIIRTFKRENDNPEEIKFIQFSPDGRLLATSSLDDKEIVKIWNMEKTQLPLWRTLTLSENEKSTGEVVKSMAFSPDGKYLVAGLSSGNIVVYDIGFNLTNILRIHSKPVIGIGFTIDSRFLISGSLDNSIKYSDIKNNDLLNWQNIEGEFTLLQIIPKTDVIKKGMVITSGKSKAYTYSLPEFSQIGGK